MPALQLDDGTELYFEDHYFGPPWRNPEAVLLVHGVAESSLAWFGWVPVLASRYRVLRPDLRGFGRSSIPPPGYAWSLPAFAADLNRFLDKLAVERIHLVGAKLGGSIALQFAADYPERVRTLSIVSAPIKGPAHTADPKLLSVTRKISDIGVRAWAEGTQRLRLGTSAPQAQVDFWNDFMARSDVRVCSEVEQMAIHMDLSDALPRITAPTLVFGIEASALEKPDTVAAWVKRIPRSEMCVLTGDGYHPAAARPTECAQKVSEFILRQ